MSSNVIMTGLFRPQEARGVRCCSLELPTYILSTQVGMYFTQYSTYSTLSRYFPPRCPRLPWCKWCKCQVAPVCWKACLPAMTPARGHGPPKAH